MNSLKRSTIFIIYLVIAIAIFGMYLIINRSGKILSESPANITAVEIEIEAWALDADANKRVILNGNEIDMFKGILLQGITETIKKTYQCEGSGRDYDVTIYISYLDGNKDELLVTKWDVCRFTNISDNRYIALSNSEVYAWIVDNYR